MLRKVCLMRFRYSFTVVVLVLLFGAAPRAQAGLIWTIDSSQSSLEILGKAKLGTLATLTGTPQGPGAAKAPLAGSLTSLANFASGFELTSSEISLQDTGSWSPLPGGAIGAAPANIGLGGAFSASVAFRNIEIALITPSLPTTGGPSIFSFDPSATLSFVGGSVDYRATFFFTISGGSSDIVGSSGLVSGSGATIEVDGILATLTMPFSATGFFVDIDTAEGVTGELDLTGIIVATAVIPEPSTVVSMLMGAPGVAFIVLRRARAARASRKRPA